jgi:hypothetical protein
VKASCVISIQLSVLSDEQLLPLLFRSSPKPSVRSLQVLAATVVEGIVFTLIALGGFRSSLMKLFPTTVLMAGASGEPDIQPESGFLLRFRFYLL